MKNKLKKALKLGILIFGFSLLLWNCDVMENTARQEVQQEGTITEISFDEFKLKANLNNQAKNLSRFFDINKSSFKSSNNYKSTGGFENAIILTDNIIKIKKDNFTTYTFTILAPTENNEFYNLVLYVNDNQEIYKSHILKYKPSEKWLSDTTQYFSGSVEIINNDIFNVNNLLQSKTSQSAKSSSVAECIDDVIISYECSNGVEGHREGNPGSPDCVAHSFYYYITLITSPCTAGLGDDGGDFDPNTGGGTSTSGGGDSGIVTAPNTIPYTSQLKNFESGTLNATERTYYNRDSNTKNTIDRFLIERNFSNIAKTDAKTALDFSSKYKLNFEQFNWVFNNRDSEDLQELKSDLVDIGEITPEIEGYVKASINSEVETNNDAEIDFENRIINILEGKALCVYNKLMNSGTGFKNAIKKFDGKFPVSHLKFKFDPNMTSNTIRAYTRAPENYVINIVLNGNSTKDASYQKRPNLLVAKTIIHEVIHAEMFRKLLSLANSNGNINVSLVNRMLQQGDYPGMLDYYFRNGQDINSNWQHQQMATHYRQTIGRILQEFDTGIVVPLNEQPSQFYMDLAWEGLNDSDIIEWQTAINQPERDRINDVINSYTSQHSNQNCTN